jgi:SAM-dependent methyltransferase
MTAAVTRERWQEAQGAELSFWKDMDFYELLKACAEKAEFWSRFAPAELSGLIAGKDVLEIGCGPLGLSVVSFSGLGRTVKRLVKTDPLAHLEVRTTRPGAAQWADRFLGWVEELASEGEYVQVAGEDIAFDAVFDTVIAYNVLDHVRAPDAILANAGRALRPGGALVIGVDCLSWLGRIRFELITRRTARGTILVNAHPHTFLPHDVSAMIERAGLRLTGAYGIPGPLRRFAGRHFRPAFVATR